jgi:hypothetical protein
MDVSDLSLGILIIEFIDKYITLSSSHRNLFLTQLKSELSAMDDRLGFIFDNLLEILYYEKNPIEIEIIINNFIEVYNIDKNNIEICIKYCLDYLNDFITEYV